MDKLRNATINVKARLPQTYMMDVFDTEGHIETFGTWQEHLGAASLVFVDLRMIEGIFCRPS